PAPLDAGSKLLLQLVDLLGSLRVDGLQVRPIPDHQTGVVRCLKAELIEGNGRAAVRPQPEQTVPNSPLVRDDFLSIDRLAVHAEPCVEFDKALAIVRSNGIGFYLPWALGCLGYGRLLLGELSEATKLLEAAVEHGRSTRIMAWHPLW